MENTFIARHPSTGREYKCRLFIEQNAMGGKNVALMVWDIGSKSWQLYGDLTVYAPGLRKNEVCVNSPEIHMAQGIFEKNEFGYNTGKFVRSGHFAYPVYHVDFVEMAKYAMK